MNRNTFTAAIFLLLVLLWAIALRAAEPNGVYVPGFSAIEAAKAEGIGLIGPTNVELGREITIRLTGTPSLDLGKPLIDQLGWLMGDDRMFVYLAAPGQDLHPLDVRGELVFSREGATMQALLRIEPTLPGEHRVLVDWNQGQNQLVSHRFIVGGDPGPGPDPPDPPIPPEPGGPWQILMFHQNLKASSQEQRMLLTSQRIQQEIAKAGHALLGILDVDSSGVGGSRGKYTDWWRVIEGDPLPRIAIAPLRGGDILDHPLPATEAEFWKLLETAK